MQVSVENYMVHHYPEIERFPELAKKVLFGTMKKLFHENQINTFMAENAHKDTFSYVEAVVDYFDISIGLKTNELTHIPSYGRTVIIANHPLGALDAMALLHLLKDVVAFKVVGKEKGHKSQFYMHPWHLQPSPTPGCR